jgi:hypothetical protein
MEVYSHSRTACGSNRGGGIDPPSVEGEVTVLYG